MAQIESDFKRKQQNKPKDRETPAPAKRTMEPMKQPIDTEELKHPHVGCNCRPGNAKPAPAHKVEYLLWANAISSWFEFYPDGVPRLWLTEQAVIDEAENDPACPVQVKVTIEPAR
jgi:hypothetical protein